jgi:hypothetical protein
MPAAVDACHHDWTRTRGGGRPALGALRNAPRGDVVSRDDTSRDAAYYRIQAAEHELLAKLSRVPARRELLERAARSYRDLAEQQDWLEGKVSPVAAWPPNSHAAGS